MKTKYSNIVSHYEACFQKYGDTHKGVDWPNMPDLEKRYEVMLQLIKDEKAIYSLLDFGCGTAMLYDYMLKSGRQDQLKYAGLDMGQSFVEQSKLKYPELDFYHLDILKDETKLPQYDYIVMNGVFTEKCDLSFDEMFQYFKEVLEAVFNKTQKGLAFNVMSKAVDWEREDLFHLSTDLLIDFLTKELSRNFVIRNDYGLYEYTTYVYK